MALRSIISYPERPRLPITLMSRPSFRTGIARSALIKETQSVRRMWIGENLMVTALPEVYEMYIKRIMMRSNRSALEGLYPFKVD